MKFELKVTELSVDDIATILSGASYGIGYWCSSFGIENSVFNQYREEGECIEIIQARAIKDGNDIIFIDNEDENNYHMTYKSLLIGVEKFINTGRCVDITNIFVDGNEDSEDMDLIIQYSLFGEIVFG